MMSAAGRPNWSSPDLQIVLGELVEVVLACRLTGDVDLEARLGVGLLHGRDDALGVVGVRDGDLHEGRVPVAGHERRSTRHTVQPAQLGGELCGQGAEGRRVDLIALRAHDHGFCCSRPPREGLRPQLQGALRLGIVGRPSFGRQGIAEQGSHRNEGESRRHRPGGDYAPRMPGAGERDGLCDPHLPTPLYLVTTYSHPLPKKDNDQSSFKHPSMSRFAQGSSAL